LEKTSQKLVGGKVFGKSQPVSVKKRGNSGCQENEWGADSYTGAWRTEKETGSSKKKKKSAPEGPKGGFSLGETW